MGRILEEVDGTVKRGSAPGDARLARLAALSRARRIVGAHDLA